MCGNCVFPAATHFCVFYWLETDIIWPWFLWDQYHGNTINEEKVSIAQAHIRFVSKATLLLLSNTFVANCNPLLLHNAQCTNFCANSKCIYKCTEYAAHCQFKQNPTLMCITPSTYYSYLWSLSFVFISFLKESPLENMRPVSQPLSRVYTYSIPIHPFHFSSFHHFYTISHILVMLDNFSICRNVYRPSGSVSCSAFYGVTPRHTWAQRPTNTNRLDITAKKFH